MSYLLTVFCFLSALVYAMAGFGGGSAYLAFFSLFGLPAREMAPLALACNLVVVSGGVYHFSRAGLLRWRTLAAYTVTSVPLAYLGGLARSDEATLKLVTGIALVFAAVALFVPTRREEAEERKAPAWAPPLLGAALGLLSGFVGIGGGIFLAPILHLLRWESSRRIAALASAFIFVNSVAGLAGQLQKAEPALFRAEYLWLLGAVLVGGQFGSRLGAYRLAPLWVKRVTAVIVLAAGAQLVWRVVSDLSEVAFLRLFSV